MVRVFNEYATPTLEYAEFISEEGFFVSDPGISSGGSADDGGPDDFEYEVW